MPVKNQTIQRDFLMALYLHVIAIILVCAYLMLSDLLHSWFVKRPLPPAKTVEIEFVAIKPSSPASIKSVTHSDSANQVVQPHQVKPKVLNQTNASEKNSLQNKKIPNLRSIPPVVERKKPLMLPKPSSGSIKKQASKKVSTKAVQRQASVVSKTTRVSVAKQVFLDKAVGEKIVSRGSEKNGAVRSKVNQHQNNGVVKRTNAQMLGSKTVQSSAKRRIDVSTVKKTTEQLRPDPVIKKTLPKNPAKPVKTQVRSDRSPSNDAKIVSEVKKLVQQSSKVVPVKQTAPDIVKKNQPQTRVDPNDRLEKEKQRRMAEDLEKKRQAVLEAEKKREDEAKRVAADAEKKRQIALNEEKRRQGELEEERRQAKLAHESAVISEYGQMIIAHIQRHAVFNPGMDGYRSNLKIKLAKSGDVLSVALVGTSGNVSFDQLAINAVYKASPLPLPEDNSIVEKMQSINLIVSPSEMHH